MATMAPSTWSYRDPGLWPSIAYASALLLSLEARARMREHMALSMDAERTSLLESLRDNGRLAPGTHSQDRPGLHS